MQIKRKRIYSRLTDIFWLGKPPASRRCMCEVTNPPAFVARKRTQAGRGLRLRNPGANHQKRRILVSKKHKAIGIAIFAVFLATLCFLWYIYSVNQTTQPSRGMFEWNEEAVYNPQGAMELIETLSVTRWYQEFPEDKKAMAQFTEYLHDENVAVYALLGSVEWGFEPDGASLTKELQALVRYNKRVEAPQRLDGVMVDVEPYTSVRFKQNPKKYMDYYVSGMIQAYRAVKGSGLRIVQCIPRHYDDQGLTAELELLIADACDEVAVMNYDCGNEVEKIATEATLARRYSKELHCILEFQEVGKHGLTEDKTYRNKGLDAAHAAFKDVSKAYKPLDVVWDYHWTQPLNQMLKETPKQ